MYRWKIRRMQQEGRLQTAYERAYEARKLYTGALQRNAEAKRENTESISRLLNLINEWHNRDVASLPDDLLRNSQETS